MFNPWHNVSRWLDLPDADYFVVSIEDGTATIEQLDEILADFNLAETKANRRILYGLVTNPEMVAA